jgi:GT2 family glycosyltransferase
LSRDVLPQPACYGGVSRWKEEVPPFDRATSSVAVVLVNWNNSSDTIECLASLLALTHPAFHVYVIDNDSADNSVDAISHWLGSPVANPSWRALPGVARITDGAPCKAIPHRIVDAPDQALDRPADGYRVTIVRGGSNLGFAGGCNLGMTVAGVGLFDYFWFVNTDAVVTLDALEALLRRATHLERPGIIGSTLLYYNRPDTVQALGGGRLLANSVATKHIGQGRPLRDIPAEGATVERELAYICGASMLVSNEYIRRVGAMREDYFLYYEDFDWAARGRGIFRLGYAPQSVIFHKSGASSSKRIPDLSSRYYYRNRLLFARRFFPERLAATQRQLVVAALRHLLRGRWQMARSVAAALRDSGLKADSPH